MLSSRDENMNTQSINKTPKDKKVLSLLTSISVIEWLDKHRGDKSRQAFLHSLLVKMAQYEISE